jgi:hypothetical protein
VWLSATGQVEMSDDMIAIAVYVPTTRNESDMEYDGKFWKLVDGDDETGELAEEFICSVGEDNIKEPLLFRSEPYLFVIERTTDEEE